MNSLAILNLLAVGLELCVPSYALRLVRRFGARSVGSFVVIAFLSLALLHLVNTSPARSSSDLRLSLVYGAASLLLLIGLGHTETVCRAREQARTDAQALRSRLDTEARERAENLLQIKQEMAQEIVRLQHQVEALSSSERQYRYLFSQYPQAMWMFDLRNGRILLGNQAALNQYGFSQQEFSSLCAKDLLAREATEAFQAEAAKPCSSLEPRGVWRHRRKDRAVMDVEVLAMDLRFGECPARLMIVQDIGPRQAREAQVCEQQRFRTLQRVAQGIACHFGGILGVVEEQATLLNAKAGENIDSVVNAVRRGQALLRQLLAAAACGDAQVEPVDLNAFVLGRQALLGRLAGERNELHLQLTQELPIALADSRVLEHVLVNLLLNARQALPTHGGAIEIGTRAAWRETSSAAQRPDAVPGHYLALTVRDNGHGMPADIQAQLFEPFFTTRENKQAMGLGLAVVYGAAKQLGGWVELATELGGGTEVTVFLPAARLAAPASNVEAPPIAPGSRETILLVEPNDRVRDLARHLLQRNGYKVVEIDSAATAALLMESLAPQAQLLIIDVRLPTGESGHELAEQFLQFNPGLRVVYAGAPSAETPNLPPDSKVLLKPYTPDQLVQTVATSLATT